MTTDHTAADLSPAATTAINEWIDQTTPTKHRAGIERKRKKACPDGWRLSGLNRANFSNIRRFNGEARGGEKEIIIIRAMTLAHVRGMRRLADACATPTAPSIIG